MQNDRLIKYTTYNNRHDKQGKQTTSMFSELWEKLKIPARGTETLAEYLNLKKADQDNLKDVGGFVGGTFNGQRRKACDMAGRDLIALDLDNIPAGGTDDVLRRIEGLGCGYCAFSTRKHQNAAPRLRAIFPLLRTVTADEYEPIARKLAELIGMVYMDRSTFESARLMYWPSCCRDSQYVYKVGDKQAIDADAMLAQYANWHNTELWPKAPGEQNDYKKLAAKQGDPEAKNGTVGAFCRTYDICHAMGELLPGVYEPVDNAPDRYTFTGGSTTGGAVLYDNGKFLFSHHATDPCSGRLVNSFDLVRLHKFSDADDEAAPGTPVNRLPSYNAMCEYANALSEVKQLRTKEDFADISADNTTAEESDLGWTQGLDTNAEGGYLKSIKNIRLILEHHPSLGGCVQRDMFAGKIRPAHTLPWERPGHDDTWTDADTAALREFLEQWFKPSKQDVCDSITRVAEKNAYHPVRDRLKSLKPWDGIQRLDTLFIDYIGADDCQYVRSVTRKAFVACVARVMSPGCKFDYMVVLVGRQGRGKSSILHKMGGDWFSDSLITFEGKEAMESIQGKWIIEIPELNAFYRSELNAVKSFITKQSDYYRAAYAQFTRENPRQCVFFGTTNNADCLKDATGGRRFWPIDIDRRQRTKDIFTDLANEHDQIWAEAIFWYEQGEALYLPPELETIANAEQEQHREAHPWEDTIRNFIEKPIPVDWEKWNINNRQLYWNNNVADQNKISTKQRDRICVREIWQEALCKDLASLTPQNANVISSVLNSLPDWNRAGNQRCGEPYGIQKAYKRKPAN